MINFRKGAFAALAAAVAAAGVTAAVIPHMQTMSVYAVESGTAAPAVVEEIETAALDITDDAGGKTLNGLKSGTVLKPNSKLVIPEGVTAVKENAFADCWQLLCVTIPTTLKSIGDNAFSGCTGIVEVINKSVNGDFAEFNNEYPYQMNTEFGGVGYYALHVCTDEAESKLVSNDGYLFCADMYNPVENEEDRQIYLVGYAGAQTELTFPVDFGGKSYRVYNYAFRGYEFTSVSAKASKIDQIGQSAFYQCAALEEAILPDDLEIIYNSAFEGCSSLAAIVIPEKVRELGVKAFYDCASLGGTLTVPAGMEIIGNEAFVGADFTVVDFADRAETSYFLEIGNRAFAGNNSITVLTLPEGTGNLGTGAFAECRNLDFVYIPDDMGFVCNADEPDNMFFDNDTVIIFPSYGAYRVGASNGYMITHTGNMTFPVDFTFVGSEDGGESGGVFEYQRLAGKGFNYAKNADGSWAEISGEDAQLPVQNGYKFTQWFRHDDYTQGVGLTEINDALDFAKSGYSGPITYYARYIAKPAVATKTQTYDEHSFYSAADFIDGSLNNDEDEVFVVSLVEGGDTGLVQHAGQYTLEITLNDDTETYPYGEWSTPLFVPVTVDRKGIEFPDDVTWQSSGNNLTGGNVYIYGKDADRKYFYSMPREIPAGYTLLTVLPVAHSIVRYKNSDVTLSVNDTGKLYTAVYEGMTFNGAAVADGENTAGEVGRYEAKALLNAVSDYRFLRGGEMIVDNSLDGIKVVISDDGKSAMVTKVWYMLDLGNALLGFDDNAYNIAGWRYKEASQAEAPVVKYTDENTYSHMQFMLVKDGTNPIRDNSATPEGWLAIDRFDRFVNASMPAGNYALTFKVPDVMGVGGEVDYSEFTETYNFTVLPAQFQDEWKEDLPLRLMDVSTRYSGGVILYDNTLKLNLWSEEVIRSFNVTREGVWADGAYDGMYSDRFELKFNLARMQSNEYLSRDEFLKGGDDLFKPVKPDSYTVYYQFEAKNYEPLVNLGDDVARRNYKYQLVIFQVVTPPEAERLTYTGVRTLPYVPESPLYTISYDENANSYIDATRVHKVKLTLVDGVHCKWLVNNAVSENRELDIDVFIERAENSESVNLSMPQWLYGSFDYRVHFPVWSTYFTDADDPDFYSYKLVDGNGKEYGTVKTDEHGKKYLDFSDAGVGTYTLTATAKGYKEGVPATNIYNWKEYTESMTVIINKGIIGWSVTPNVMQWRFGGYNAEVNLVLGATDGDHAVKFKVTSDRAGNEVISGLEEFGSVDGIVSKEVGEKLAKLRVGSYYLWASVDETAQYMGLNPEPLEFAVTIAQNYWEEAPSIVTWLEGKYDKDVNVITYIPHFGKDKTTSIVITVAGDSEQVVYDSENDINLLDSAKMGAYELRAMLVGTDDYSELEYSFTFQIFEKEGLAWWITLLIVVGTVGVIALILFILHQKGVLQLLTGRFVLAMRARATVDATIAAVRANKVAAEAKKTVEIARQLELEEERKRKQEELDALPEEDRAAISALNEQAKAATEQAEQLIRQADEAQRKADELLQNAGGQKPADVEAEQVQTAESAEPEVSTEEPEASNGADNENAEDKNEASGKNADEE